MARMHDTSRFTTAPELADLEAYAREAFATIPAELRRYVGEVMIQVNDFPEDGQVQVPASRSIWKSSLGK